MTAFRTRRHSDEHVRGFVYFVHAPAVKRTKIGFAANVYVRLGDLQIGSPVPLVLRGVVPGYLLTETRAHDAFSSFKSHGEWFDDNEWLDLLADRLSYPSPQWVTDVSLEFRAIRAASTSVQLLESLVLGMGPLDGTLECTKKKWESLKRKVLLKAVGPESIASDPALRTKEALAIASAHIGQLVPRCLCCFKRPKERRNVSRG